MKDVSVKILDCTLRDGGYYNAWDFDKNLINAYLEALVGSGVELVELGFRSLSNTGYKGACAFTTDDFARTLRIPQGMTPGVMVNASELIDEGAFSMSKLQRLFPEGAEASPIGMVRLACHLQEFVPALDACSWLKDRGYIVGINLMQISTHNSEDVSKVANAASNYPVDVVYFADSIGSLNGQQIKGIVEAFRAGWGGELGFHAHDNLGLALSNALRAIEEGVTWVDCTMMGMGRGPGNTKTEQLLLHVSPPQRHHQLVVTIEELISNYFRPLQIKYGWGPNPYYFMAGVRGIHPTYIQEMHQDPRYKSEDIVTVIDQLGHSERSKYNSSALGGSRQFFRGEPRGKWQPESVIEGRKLLIISNGPGAMTNRDALEQLIKKEGPYVLALNTHQVISEELIDARVACHPMRILTDSKQYEKFASPLITPASMLPEEIATTLDKKRLHDFGISMKSDKFAFDRTHCNIPIALAAAYALGIAGSGKAANIVLAGFDGYGSGDARTSEMQWVFGQFRDKAPNIPILSVTPTEYTIPTASVHAL